MKDDPELAKPAVRMQAADRAGASGAKLRMASVGKGRVMLFASSCDRSWTNFPIRPAYLPWARQLAAYLTEEPMGRDTFHLAGDVVQLTPPGGEPPGPMRVKKPVSLGAS